MELVIGMFRPDFYMPNKKLTGWVYPRVLAGWVIWNPLKNSLEGRTTGKADTHTHVFWGKNTIYVLQCPLSMFYLQSIYWIHIYMYIYIYHISHPIVPPHIPFKRCLKCFSVNFQGSAWCPARNPRWVALARDGRWECGNTDFFGFFMEDIRCYKQQKRG